MFLLYHSKGYNICESVLYECYVNDLYTITCSVYRYLIAFRINLFPKILVSKQPEKIAKKPPHLGLGFKKPTTFQFLCKKPPVLLLSVTKNTDRTLSVFKFASD
jgi:hypothetical protein